MKRKVSWWRLLPAWRRVLILNAEDKIEFVNQALGNMLAEQYGDINGKTLMEAFLNADLQKSFLKFKEKHITVVEKSLWAASSRSS